MAWKPAIEKGIPLRRANRRADGKYRVIQEVLLVMEVGDSFHCPHSEFRYNQIQNACQTITKARPELMFSVRNDDEPEPGCRVWRIR